MEGDEILVQAMTAGVKIGDVPPRFVPVPMIVQPTEFGQVGPE